MKIAAFVLAAFVPVAVSAQDTSSVKKLFEAGKYDDVVRDVSTQRGKGSLSFSMAYLAAQSYLKLEQPDSAKEELSWIEKEGDEIWASIARSAIALVDDRSREAIKAARKAVEGAPDHLYSQYQLGLVYSHVEDNGKAAEAFEKATQIDPLFAYAHYYAGLEYNKIRRVDRMAGHFETFLKLAPQAPERPAVESIMRTVRGR